MSEIDGYDSLTAITCPSRTCLAADDGGNVLASTDPTAAASSWTLMHVDGAALSGLACPTTSLCAGVDSAGDVVSSTDPTGGPNAWTVTNVDGINALSAISCPAVSLCAAVDNAGNVVASTDPAGGASVWNVSPIDPTFAADGSGAQLVGVSCPSVSLCVAADDAGNIVTSTDPTGGPAAWTVSDVDGTTPLTSVSCASGHQCLATDATDVLASADPTGGVAAWAVTAIGLNLSRVWCSPTSLCLGSSGPGSVDSTLAPDGSAWSMSNRPLIDLQSATCETRSRCLGVSSFGTVAVGTAAEGPTQRQLSALLSRGLVSTGGAARIPALVANGGYTLSFHGLGSGRLTVSWYQVARAARLARASHKPVLVAFGSARSGDTGAVLLKLRLTPNGKALLRRVRRITLAAQGRLTAGKTVVTAARSFTLHR